MYLKLLLPILRVLKTTRWWKNNYLILQEFKNFRRIVVLAMIFMFLAAIFEGFGLGFLLAFLQSLATPNVKPVETGICWFDIWILGVNGSSISRFYRISTLLIIITWIRAAFNYFAQLHSVHAEVSLVDSLRKRIFDQLQAQSLSFFANRRSGELIDILTNEVERTRQIFSGLSFLVTRGITLVVYSVSMFLISWQLSLISILLFGLLAIGSLALNRRIREFSFAISIATGRFTSTALEFINGIRTIHAFSTLDFEHKRYYQASFEVVKAWKKVYSTSILVKPLAEGISTILLISMIAVALTSGLLPIASLLTFFFVLFRLVPTVNDINGVSAQLSTMGGSIDNIKQLLRTDDKIYFKNGNIEFPGLQQSIELVSVDFSYDATNLVLQDITLTIEQGQITALVGASGAGKTTLADLITRFYDPTQGKILIDGVDIREFEINSLRRKLAVVSQDTFIFNTSVWNNIAYGAEGASATDIEEAARLANAIEFIQDMPEGFGTQLGDRGVRLSGGQRQRLAIARALLRSPDILILDEATSALDSISERLIQESLEKLSMGRTVITIAHRLSTIANADKVVVLEQGHIVEQGRYEGLLKQRGKFWKYYQMQQQSQQVD